MSTGRPLQCRGVLDLYWEHSRDGSGNPRCGDSLERRQLPCSLSLTLTRTARANRPGIACWRTPPLQQVLVNLMINGIEAMAGLDSEPKSLLVRSALPNQRELLVSVEDTGSGVNPDHAGRLFAPFFTAKPQGIGMGLRISQSIIDAHGGRLWAESNEPRGAVFYFTLPIKAGQA